VREEEGPSRRCGGNGKKQSPPGHDLSALTEDRIPIEPFSLVPVNDSGTGEWLGWMAYQEKAGEVCAEWMDYWRYYHWQLMVEVHFWGTVGYGVIAGCACK